MEKVYTTHQIGRICRVDNTTVINWIKVGKLQAYKTPGGHRRIEQSSLLHFLKKYKMPIPDELSEGGLKKILIVDDDKSVVNVICKILKKTNKFEIKTASDGFQAGQILSEFKPDLLILDLKLPGIDGFDVCRSIKNNKSKKHIKIIAISGYNDDSYRKTILSCGADDFLGKPLNRDVLLKTIDKHLKD